MIAVLIQEKTFSLRLYFKTNRENIGSSKNGTRDFQNNLPFKISIFLYDNHWKIPTFFRKLGYRFFFESTKFENAYFPYKIALSEANVKTNRMGSTKSSYHKEPSFTNNYIIFFKKKYFSLATFYKEFDLIY